jgi:cytochrome o ubiquinol oxidase subunit 1
VVHDNDAWSDMKKRGYQRPVNGFIPIHMPKNTAAGIVIAGLATAMGFALIWHMWALAALLFVSVIAVSIAHTFNYKRDYHIPVDEVVYIEGLRTQELNRLAAN